MIRRQVLVALVALVAGVLGTLFLYVGVTTFQSASEWSDKARRLANETRNQLEHELEKAAPLRRAQPSDMEVRLRRAIAVMHRIDSDRAERQAHVLRREGLKSIGAGAVGLLPVGVLALLGLGVRIWPQYRDAALRIVPVAAVVFLALYALCLFAYVFYEPMRPADAAPLAPTFSPN